MAVQQIDRESLKIDRERPVLRTRAREETRKKATKPSQCTGCAMYPFKKMPDLPAGTKDILVVAGAPMERDITVGGALQSRAGLVVHRIFNEQLRTMPKGSQPKVAYTNAVRCNGGEEQKVTADIITQCAPLLLMEIQRVQPKVIFLLGRDALRSFGFTAAMDSYRGGIMEQTIYGHKVYIIASFHPARLRSSPGLVHTFKKDALKCISLWSDLVDDTAMDLRCPTTYEGIMEQLSELETYILSNPGKKKYVALDTETTSLTPWVEEDRMIAISLAWGSPVVGLGFPVDHVRAKHLSLKHKESILTKISGLLSGNPDAFVSMHNAKFDEKWLDHAYIMEITANWDTMLGEHLIDEDKSGQYGLKQLTKDWFPGYGKYEEELQEHLSRIQKERKLLHTQQTAEYKEVLQNAAVEYWESLEEDTRLHIVSKWIDSGDITTYDNKVIELEYRKLTKKQLAMDPQPRPLLYQRSKKQIGKLFLSLPEEALEILEGYGSDFLKSVVKSKPDPRLLDSPTFEDIPMDVMLKYAAIDAVMTLKIAYKQFRHISDERVAMNYLQRKEAAGPLRNMRSLTWGYANVSMPLSRMLTKMEHRGVRLDRDKIKRYRDHLEEKARETRHSLMMEAGYEFNPNSTPDLCKLLFDDLGLPVLKRSAETNAPSTDAAVINDLYLQNPNPILKHLLQYRKIVKCKSTYLENWLQRSAYDGRLHASFNINGTATYRLSSSNPNLQNVMFFVKGVDDPDGATDANGNILPLNLKSVFIPDDPYTQDIYDLDIANAEMRVLCAYSRDDALIKAFNEGMDLHCLTASAIGEYTYDEIAANKEDKSSPHYKLRQMAKAINFGTIYCMGPLTLARNLWEKNRIEISEEDAQVYLDKFFERYPGVRAYIDRTNNFIARYKFTHTYTGRMRRFPILQYNTAEANRCGRQGVNARIQTTSAEIVNKNMIDVDNEIVTPGGGRMLLTVHDSMVFQMEKGIPRDEIITKLDKSIITNVQQDFPWLPVPWKYDVDRGPNYGMCKGF